MCYKLPKEGKISKKTGSNKQQPKLGVKLLFRYYDNISNWQETHIS